MIGQSYGIVEMMDEKSSDKGFFCMDLVSHITDDPQFDGSWEYWHNGKCDCYGCAEPLSGECYNW